MNICFCSWSLDNEVDTRLIEVPNILLYLDFGRQSHRPGRTYSRAHPINEGTLNIKKKPQGPSIIFAHRISGVVVRFSAVGWNVSAPFGVTPFGLAVSPGIGK